MDKKRKTDKDNLLNKRRKQNFITKFNRIAKIFLSNTNEE
jgi:hypothetical protein